MGGLDGDASGVGHRQVSRRGARMLRAEPGIEVVVNTKLAAEPPALRQALMEADGIAIRSGTQLTAEVLEGQTRLKAIVRRAWASTTSTSRPPAGAGLW